MSNVVDKVLGAVSGSFDFFIEICNDAGNTHRARRAIEQIPTDDNYYPPCGILIVSIGI